jgi:hypothetical protein
MDLHNLFSQPKPAEMMDLKNSLSQRERVGVRVKWNIRKN